VSLWKLLAIKIQPDVIFRPFGFPITNTLLCTWISIVVLVVFFFFATRRRDLIPSGMQNFAEWAVEALLGIVQGVSGKEKGKKFFPLVATLFLFIFLSNLLDVFPGVDTVGWIDTSAIGHLSSSPWLGIFPQNTPVFGFLLFGALSNKLIPWIRPATTDLNLNFAMAIIVVITVQAFGFYSLGPKNHLGHYFNFGTLFRSIIHFNPGGLMQGVIEVFVGLLEIIDELARILSLSFRLFGNIFAGSIVLAVFAFVLPFVSDIVFIPFEVFIAFVQALVFSLLTLVYLEIATSSHTAHEESGTIEEAEQQFAHDEQRTAAATH
jgi:F-type H+-transporting ATPase subunit a